MKIFSTLTFLLLIIFQSISFAATETFSASGEYTMSDYDTPEIAELRALDYARRSAAEQAGIYLESYSRMENFKLETDEIKTVASKNIKILDKPKISREILDSGVAKIRVDIQATVDTADLDAAIKKSELERQAAVKRYEELQQLSTKLDKDIADFQKKIAKLKADEPNDEISEEQERLDREFLSKQKLEEFNNSFNVNDINDLKYDFNLIDEAIKIDPKNFKAYGLRSMTDFLKWISELKNFMIGDLSYNNLTIPTPDIKYVNKAIIIAPDEFKSDSFVFLAGCYEIKAMADEKLGNNDEAKQNLDKALENFTKAIEVDPNNAKVYIVRGNFYKKSDYNKALADYNKAIELEPNNAANYKERSAIHSELKNYSDALKDLETFKKLDEENFDGVDYISLGNIYKGLKNYPLALESYNKAIEQKPRINWIDSRPLAYFQRATFYMELGEYDKALADYDNGAKLAKSSEIKWIRQLGDEVKQRIIERKNIADKIAEKYGKISDKDVDSFIKRGDEYYLEDFDLLAVEDYTRAISTDPKNQRAYFKRGRAHKYLEDYKAALNDFDSVIKLNPKYEDGDAYIKRGEIYEKLGDNKKALADYKEAFKLAPHSEVARKNIMRIRFPDKFNELETLSDRAYDLKNNEDYSNAIAEYTKILELDLENQDAYFNRGLSYSEMNDYKSAIVDFSKLIELNPKNVFAYYHRGNAYQDLQNYEQAISDYTQAIKLNPNYTDAYNNRGWTYYLLKNYSEAIKDFDKALEIDSNHQFAKKNRELCYKEINK